MSMVVKVTRSVSPGELRDVAHEVRMEVPPSPGDVIIATDADSGGTLTLRVQFTAWDYSTEGAVPMVVGVVIP